jgi:hypothetical protein
MQRIWNYRRSSTGMEVSAKFKNAGNSPGRAGRGGAAFQLAEKVHGAEDGGLLGEGDVPGRPARLPAGEGLQTVRVRRADVSHRLYGVCQIRLGSQANANFSVQSLFAKLQGNGNAPYAPSL